VRYFCSNGALGKMRGLLKVEVIVILHQQRCGGLVWYAMDLEWPRSYEQRLIARDAITSTCISRKDATKSTMIIFIDRNIDRSTTL
jgi:hypothetical protein